MEYKIECGCIVVESPPNFGIRYCSLHKAAPDLYEALKDLLWHYRNYINIGDQGLIDRCIKTIAKAKNQ